MSSLRAIADFGLISEYDDLVSLRLAQTGSHDLGTLDSGIPYQGVPASPDKQHSIKFDSLTFRYTQTLDFYRLFRGYLVLLSTCFNNSVNLSTLLTGTAILTPLIARCQTGQEGH